MSPPRHLHIFLSSPGDVAEERATAKRVLSDFPYDPLLRGRVTIDIVAWDTPVGSVPMYATVTPQAAVDRGLRRPSQCDIVIIILWSRMGTLLSPEHRRADGTRYASGTEWEYEDALQSPHKPEILVYRRTSNSILDPDRPDYQDALAQLRRVDDFFAAFQNVDGSFRRGFNSYQDPEDFRRQFEFHLRGVIKRLLDSHESQPGLAPAARSLLDDSGRATPAPHTYEEPRRLDAAMVRETKASHPTEVWAQICLPSSPGLRRTLPARAEPNADASAEDIRAGDLPVVFTVDPATNAPLPARLSIELDAPDFVPSRSSQEVFLPSERDSTVLVFPLTAPVNGDRAKIYVTVKQQLGSSSVFTLGSLVLLTHIKSDAAYQSADPVWTLVDRVLGSLASGVTQPVIQLSEAFEGQPQRVQLEWRVVEGVDKARIEKYLKLDIPLLCSLLPVSRRDPTVFCPSGQTAGGQHLFEDLKPALREILCDQWRLCDKLPNTEIDNVTLVATIADLIAPVVGKIRPELIAAILVKLGLRQFCNCGVQSALE